MIVNIQLFKQDKQEEKWSKRQNKIKIKMLILMLKIYKIKISKIKL